MRTPIPLSARLAVPVLLAAALSLAGPPSGPRPPAAAAAATGDIEARVIALGKPIAGLAVQVRSTGIPGMGTWIEDSSSVADTSDVNGLVHFRGLAPGHYHVIGHCGRIPSDCIAGTIATRADVVAGATAHATITLRRGGRILGQVVEGEQPISDVSIETESNDALPSTCPMLESRNPGPDGRFTIGKVPVGAFVWVKAMRDMGRGRIEVWKDFKLAAPETLTGTWEFPRFDSTSLATARLGVRLDEGQPADHGRIELLSLGPDHWRYTASVDFTEAESLLVLPSLPPGPYTLRAVATPGVQRWWNASPDTLVLAPGARRTKLVAGRLQR